jgi:hypothetical protein
MVGAVVACLEECLYQGEDKFGESGSSLGIFHPELYGILPFHGFALMITHLALNYEAENRGGRRRRNETQGERSA